MRKQNTRWMLEHKRWNTRRMLEHKKAEQKNRRTSGELGQVNFDDLCDNVDGVVKFDSNSDHDAKREIDESGNLFKEAKQSYNKVDDKLLEFIENFVTNQNAAAKQKKRLKWIFFTITMIVFCIIVITPIVSLIVMLQFEVKNYVAVLGTVIAAVVEVLATVIVLPKIVAEYLFNKEEENANIKIVELMQKYSDAFHGYDK